MLFFDSFVIFSPCLAPASVRLSLIDKLNNATKAPAVGQAAATHRGLCIKHYNILSASYRFVIVTD